MSAAAINPSIGPAHDPSAHGATALREESEGHPRHLLGNALRAIKVFATTAFGVVVLGEYSDEIRTAH